MRWSELCLEHVPRYDFGAELNTGIQVDEYGTGTS